MDKICRAMMNLIGSEICGNAVCADEIKALSDDELKALYKLSKSHDLAHLVGNALIKNNLLDEENPNGDENHDGDKTQGGGENHSGVIRSEIKQKFEKQILTAIYRYENINSELETLKTAFEEEKIPFIPLKGSVIRQYYPEPWLRTSCDIDILVKEADADKASKALAEHLHYKINEKGQHDISLFSLSNIHVELHFKLMDIEFKQVSALIDIWSGGEIAPVSGYEYCMSNELFLLYHIYHMAKHFVHGGCGIKPFVDLLVIQNKIDYDEEKAEKILKESDLLLFYNHAMELMNVWFEGKPHNSVTQEMENYILQGGVYGTLEQQLAMSQNKKGGKFRHLLSKIFLSYEQMKVYYPSVKNCPILFPFYQVRRWCRILFCGGRKAAMNEIKVNAGIDKAKVETAKRLMKELEL